MQLVTYEQQSNNHKNIYWILICNVANGIHIIEDMDHEGDFYIPIYGYIKVDEVFKPAENIGSEFPKFINHG